MENVISFMQLRGDASNYKNKDTNWPFLSCFLPQFQNESSCETIQMKMTDLHENGREGGTHFHMNGLHIDSFRNRGKGQLGNGLLYPFLNRIRYGNNVNVSFLFLFHL